MYLFEDKKPIELTSEELFELVNQITLIEYKKIPIINNYQEYQDTVNDIFVYSLDKSKRNKIGINDLQKTNPSMKKFNNTLHKICKNSILEMLRTQSVKEVLYNTESIDEQTLNSHTTYDSNLDFRI